MRPIGRHTVRPHYLLAATLAALALAATATAKELPGRGTTPAFICVATTINEKGYTRMPRITRPSGNLKFDKNALKLVRMLKYVDEDGKPQETRDAQLLIKFYGNGQFAFNTYYEYGEPVPEICSTPARTR